MLSPDLLDRSCCRVVAASALQCLVLAAGGTELHAVGGAMADHTGATACSQAPRCVPSRNGTAAETPGAEGLCLGIVWMDRHSGRERESCDSSNLRRITNRQIVQSCEQMSKCVVVPKSQAMQHSIRQLEAKHVLRMQFIHFINSTKEIKELKDRKGLGGQPDGCKEAWRQAERRARQVNWRGCTTGRAGIRNAHG